MNDAEKLSTQNFFFQEKKNIVDEWNPTQSYMIQENVTSFTSTVRIIGTMLKKIVFKNEQRRKDIEETLSKFRFHHIFPFHKTFPILTNVDLTEFLNWKWCISEYIIHIFRHRISLNSMYTIHFNGDN